MRPPKSRAREWLGVSTLIVYGAIVLFAVFWPAPIDQGFSASIDKVLDVMHRNGVPEWFGYNKLEFSANVLMFVPLGFLISLLLPARFWWLALFIGPALSVGIEMTQAAFLSARFATVSDVAANSIGAFVGAVAAMLLRAVVFSRDEKVIERALWEASLARR